MTWTRDFLAGVAELLAADGVAEWREAGAYTPSETGIYLRALPSAPARAIALAHYDVDPTLFGHGTQGLQVRCRGTENPSVADDLADAVYGSLHGRRDVDLREVFAAMIWRQSHSPLPADSGGRWQTTSNFYALTTRASAHALS